MDACTHLEDHFWGTFDVDSDCSWSIWVLNDSGGSLLNGVEWADCLDAAKFLLDQKMNWNISILQEFEKSNFSSVSDWNESSSFHFNSGRAVEENTLLDELEGDVAQLAVQ